jgi:hypothetical protein
MAEFSVGDKAGSGAWDVLPADSETVLTAANRRALSLRPPETRNKTD